MVKRNPKATVTNEVLDEAVQAILGGIDKLFENVATKDDLKDVASKKDIQRLEYKIDELDIEVKNLKVDVALTPSLKQFNDLKLKVDKIASN